MSGQPSGAPRRDAGEPAAVRMLIVSSDTFPPVRVDVTVLFGEELAARGHRIDLLLQSEAACDSAYIARWGGGQVWVGPTDLGTSLFNRIRRHVRSITHDLRVFSLLRTGRYGIVEVKDKYVSGIWALLAAKLFKVRFIYWLSWPSAEEYLTRSRDGTARYPLLYWIRGAAFKVMLYRVLLPAAEHVFVQSEQMRRDVATHGVPFSKTTAVPMGVRRPAALSTPPQSSPPVIPADEPSLLYLGTLARMRRLDILIRMMAKVRLAIPEAKLYIVGRGDDPNDERLLLDEVRRLGLEASVVLVGQLPQPEALRYVRAAKVCLSPFYPTAVLNSASPTKLVEYLAMGRAVVANDHPEQRLVIEKSGGGLCVPWDESAFAAAAIRLLQEPLLAESMGQRGHDWVVANREYSVLAGEVEAQLRRIAGTTVAGPA